MDEQGQHAVGAGNTEPERKPTMTIRPAGTLLMEMSKYTCFPRSF